MSSIHGPNGPLGDTDDPLRVERTDDPADPVARARAARTVPLPRTEVADRSPYGDDRVDDGHRFDDRHDSRDQHAQTPDVVKDLREPDNRAKLLLVIAGLSALTFLLVLVNTITLQSQGGDDPVLVDGVPCLVQEGEGEDAILFCQR